MKFFITSILFSLSLTAFAEKSTSELCGELTSHDEKTQTAAATNLSNKHEYLATSCLYEAMDDEYSLYSKSKVLMASATSLAKLAKVERAKGIDLGAESALYSAIGFNGLRAVFQAIKALNTLESNNAHLVIEEEFSNLSQKKETLITELVDDIYTYNLLSSGDEFYKWVLRINEKYL